MKIEKIITLLLISVTLAGFVSAAAAVKDSGDGDIVLQAMKDELDRSMKSLQIENMEKPYYMEYSIWDQRELSIASSFGAPVISNEQRERMLKAGVRVGDYQLDNSEYLDRSSLFSAVTGYSGGIVLEDDYDAVRRGLWLASDRAYKQALKQFAGKKAYLRNQAEQEDIPDFSREKPVRLIAPLKTMEVDRAKWEKTVGDLSAIFRQYPAIHESSVEMRVNVINKYFVNSEGTVFRQPQTLVALEVEASTRAGDGTRVKHYFPYYAAGIAGMPGEKELAAGIGKMAKELTALVSAPVLEDYIGPVLFTGQASAELFTQVLAPHLSGQRPPLSDIPQMTQMATSSKLAKRLERRVLPRELTIIGDPTRTEFEKQPLIGSYAVDDQGVVPKPVTLVEKGVLKTLLMSRRPREEILHSNGHGRAARMGNPGVQAGNLFITAEKGKTYEQLKEELLQMCEDQQLPFGLIIKTLDNPAITGMDDSPGSFMSRAPQSGSKLTNPVLMYRVDAKTGKEELVRGISVSDLDVGDLKDIEAVGGDCHVLHRLVAPGGGAMGSIFSFFLSSGRSEAGIPASIAAPSVLFEELEFKKNEGKQEKPPLLTHPYFVR
jgi:hypothetical protein